MHSAGGILKLCLAVRSLAYRSPDVFLLRNRFHFGKGIQDVLEYFVSSEGEGQVTMVLLWYHFGNVRKWTNE